ncbi:MAG: DUF364 domain-containing protein [Proteobacteria bacterium]|nr:DUF364 domain-containing protein [Pseudomonadota bacterium]
MTDTANANAGPGSNPHPDPVVAVEALIAGTPEAASLAVVVGYNWTLVEGPAGTGLVTTPEKGVEGARTTGETGRFTGRGLRELAGLARSVNPYERSIGCAAINAGLNRYDLHGAVGNGLELPGDAVGRTVVVGRFPRLEERLPGAVVLERNPGPNDLPAEAAAQVIPGCARLIITASAWSNGSLAGLLRLADGADVSVVGPGTPLSPLLFDLGVKRLAGFVVSDPPALRQAIAEGAGVRQFRHFGRDVVLQV